MANYKQQQLQSSTETAEIRKEMCHMNQQQLPEPEMELIHQPKSRKVPVVYYLCRNRQLEHPHFIEVSLVSPDGLYLRDVIEKIDSLRGRGMASMYSWSCKRSYKNAFVWNDLCGDDLIFPAHGNEYVLKGSELVEENNSGRFGPARSIKLQIPKQVPEPSSSSITEDDCSSSVTKISQHSSSSGMSPESGGEKPAVHDGCHSLTKYKIYKSHGLSDASTQTDEFVKVKKSHKTCTRSLSIDSEAVESSTNESTPSSSSGCSFAGKTETLESLMKADVNNSNSSDKLKEYEEEEEEGCRVSINAKLRASNILLQLISCGSKLAQDHEFGRVLSCRSCSSNSKFRSRLLSSSVMLGELNCLSESSRFMGMRLENKEYFSGSLVDKKLLKEEGIINLKRSSSFTANRINTCDSIGNYTKCIPRSIKASLSKHPRSASMRSTVFEESPTSCILSPCSSNNGSKRILVSKKQSKKMESFKDDKENIIKIEERLASGARVIIHLEAPCDSKGNL